MGMADQSKTLELIVKARDEASAPIKGITDSLKGGVSAIGESIGNMADVVVQGVRTAGVALTGLGVGLSAYAKNASEFTVQYVGNVNRLSREIGASTQQTSQLLFVTQRLGFTVDQTSSMFGVFSRNIQQAHEGTQQAADKFSALGVKVNDASGKTRPFNDLLLDVADKFKKMPNGIEKSATAMDLFGRSGKDMIKVLNLGSDGIKDLEKQADALGITLTSKTVDSVSKFIDSQKEMKVQTDAMRITVGTLTLPVLTSFNGVLNQMLQSLIGTNGPLREVIANVLAFGGPVAVAAGTLVTFIASLTTINPILGGFATSILGVGTAFIGAGGLVFAAQQFLGLDFSPIGGALIRMFDGVVIATNMAIESLKVYAGSPEWGNLREKANKSIIAISQALDRITDQLKSGGFKAGFAQLQAEINKLHLGDLFKKTIDKLDLKGLVSKLFDKLQALPLEEESAKFALLMIRVITGALNQAGAITAQLIPPLLNSIIPIMDGLIEGLFKYVTENPLDFLQLLLTFGFLPEKVIVALASVLGKLPIIGPIAEWLIGSLKTVGDIITEPIKNIGRKITGGIKEGISETWNGLLGVLSNVGKRILEPFQNLGGKIGSMFDGAGTWLYVRGQQVVQGLLDGIGNMAGKVGTWFLDKIPGWIKEPFKKALGIKSPSTVFAQYGQFTMQGLTQGLQTSKKQVMSTLTSIGNEMGSSFEVNPNANFGQVSATQNSQFAPLLNAPLANAANNTNANQSGNGSPIVNVYAEVTNDVDMSLWARQIGWEIAIR